MTGAADSGAFLPSYLSKVLKSLVETRLSAKEALGSLLYQREGISPDGRVQRDVKYSDYVLRDVATQVMSIICFFANRRVAGPGFLGPKALDGSDMRETVEKTAQVEFLRAVLWKYLRSDIRDRIERVLKRIGDGKLESAPAGGDPAGLASPATTHAAPTPPASDAASASASATPPDAAAATGRPPNRRHRRGMPSTDLSVLQRESILEVEAEGGEPAGEGAPERVQPAAPPTVAAPSTPGTAITSAATTPVGSERGPKRHSSKAPTYTSEALARDSGLEKAQTARELEYLARNYVFCLK